MGEDDEDSMSKGNTGNRFAYVSFLQFIGVISVIFGHSMNGMDVPSILTDIKAWVYTWHMPLFFFVSAFLFSYKGGYNKGYRAVLYKRFQRLLVPYFLWNVVFAFPKYLLIPILDGVTRDAGVELSLDYFVHIILRPRDTILGHTWFLFALFEMDVIAIVFDKARRKKELWIPITLALTVVNCFGVKNRWLSIGDLMKNAVFFWCGLMAGSLQWETIRERLKTKWTVASTACLVIATTVVWAFRPEMSINTLVLGASVLVLFMIIQIVTGVVGELIEFVSINSFPIYIMHWPVIMLLRLFFYQKLGITPLLAQIINLVFAFAIPCGITCLLRKLKTPWMRKVCSVVFGM